MKESNKKVALIYGGLGAEAEISRITSEAFAQALQALGVSFEKIEATADLPQRLAQAKPDLAFIGLHGKYGEDGTVQGICEYLKIPYTGSGVLASSLSMDKAYCKMLFDKHQIPTAKYQLLNTKEALNGDIENLVKKFSLELSFPVVVKPSREGSSVGVSIVKNQEAFLAAVQDASQYDHWVIIEKFIEGKEVTVPIMGHRALTSIEIVPKTDFYNYKNKYTDGNTNYILPANIEKRTVETINELALKACELLRVRSYARVDFMLDKNEKPYIMEINTLPGCTPTSLVPKSAAYEGMDFSEFVKYLIDTADLDYVGLK